MPETVINGVAALAGWDGNNHNVARVDTNGNLSVNSQINLTADAEITGVPIKNRRYNGNLSGSDQTVYTPASGKKVQLYKAFLSVNADVTGEILLKLGSNVLAGILNPKSGGLYAFISVFPDFEIADNINDLLAVNGPAATNITINYSLSEY